MNRLWLAPAALAMVFACSPGSYRLGGFASNQDAGTQGSGTAEAGSTPDAESATDTDAESVPEAATPYCVGVVDSGTEPQEAGATPEAGPVVDASVVDAAVVDAAVVDANQNNCPGPTPTIQKDGATWTLVWSDEFNGANGSAPDPTKWAVLSGDIGASNHELEYYTSDLTNAHIQDCSLVITTTTEGASQYTCNAPNPNSPCEYTSARMQTKGIYAPQYGRIEARIQLPVGQGLWPAFWALGVDQPTVGWPACGEIDIMEAAGSYPAVNLGSLHGLNTATNGPYEDVTTTYTVPSGQPNLAQAYHTYAIEWQAGQVKFFVDDHLYSTRTQGTMPANDAWEYDQPFFLLLNVAVGGWAGPPNSSTVFPQKMLVDYVRAYSKN
jgi:beta-glucanase (GH16 family)